MPYARPTLATLRLQGRAAIAARLGLLVPTLPRWVLGILADVKAAMVSGEYGYLDFMAQQLFVSTAVGDYIDRRGNELAITRKAAAPAAGSVVFSGSAGSPVPATSTTLQSTDQTQAYVVQATGTIGSGGTVSLPVLASTPGSAANQLAGGTLSLVVAVGGVAATASVDVGGITGGTDIESDALYRGRVLARMQMPPQGGARLDYVAWAKSVPACTRAWSYPRNRGGGSVDLTFVCDARSNIVPLAADIAAVQAAILPLQPGQVDCLVWAPVPDPIAVTVGSLTPPSAAAAVQASLATLFAATTPGGARYGDGVSEQQPGGILLLEQISGAVYDAAGVTGFDLVAPAADIVSAHGHLATLGAVTFS